MTEKIIPVNGYWIRQTRDPDFAIWHRHAYPDNKDYSRKDYVPEEQLWVDHRHMAEFPYLLATDQKEFGGFTGSAYEQKRLEVVERLRPNRIKIPEFIIRKERAPEGILVVYVDGSKIRRFIDPEFVQGGHWLVYSYIPKDQVWIDATMDPRDYLPIRIHEFDEANSMSLGLDYNPAHEMAMKLEKSFRVAHGGSYASLETPLGLSPQQLLALYLDLTK